MVEPQEKKSFMMNSSPIKEEEEEDRDVDDYGESVSSTGFCCFGLCFERKPSRHDIETKSLLQLKEEHRQDTWLVKKAKEVREVSEMVAGPRWKNFIRKNGKYFSTPKKSRPQQVQYDPQSYALNFDHTGLDEEEDEGVLLGFSSKFAPPFSGELSRPVGL